MADNKKNGREKGRDLGTGENKLSCEEELMPLDKDYAHYPPTPTKQVTKHLTKKLKETEKPNTGNNRGGGKNASGNLQREEKIVTNRDEKIVNESTKIVNDNEESYSNGSGGAFEATEQVN